VESANFKSDIVPITSFKCSPCHDPGQTFNWQDSAQLVRKGTLAMDRITRPDSAVGKMPLKGAPNGPLTARELKVLFQWLSSVAIPVKSVTLSDMNANLGDTVAPALVWDPPTASNQEFTLTTSDTVFRSRGGQCHRAPGDRGARRFFVTTDDGDRKLQAKLTVTAPSFQKKHPAHHQIQMRALPRSRHHLQLAGLGVAPVGRIPSHFPSQGGAPDATGKNAPEGCSQR